MVYSTYTVLFWSLPRFSDAVQLSIYFGLLHAIVHEVYMLKDQRRILRRLTNKSMHYVDTTENVSS